MKLLSAEEIRLWDQYTIQNEPIKSIDLMERAAHQCLDWLDKNNYTHQHIHIFCGKGNNGGDGLAIARMLTDRKIPVSVHILEFGHKGTDDFQTNLARLHQYPGVVIRFIQTKENFPKLDADDLVVDALLGSGLNRGLDGVTAALVTHINDSRCAVISIDIPSGLFADRTSKDQIVIKADHTLSFQNYKLSFLMPENGVTIGDVHILDIGLHADFYQTLTSKYILTDDDTIRALYKPRNRFSHKGNFGHALIVAGGYGKIGAAILAARACLRSGAGLVTTHVPKCGYDIMQTALPEAMVMTDFNSSFITRIEDDVSKYDAIGIGPGIGTASETRAMMRTIFGQFKKPLVLDADALNIISAERELFRNIPQGSVLTPHPKEFERLFGKTADDFERMKLALAKAKELDCVILLKGHHTLIAAPNGTAFFNSTGNAGMATGGSGDVLTGIIASLLAQDYSSLNASILGTYIHGLSGDIAASQLSQEAMIAGDIIDHIPAAFLHVSAS
ncbi:MAG TPA: NAD(P)H-hydrate dehydratase [Flavitalea sp.]|nr:NAD(P)H-hydrate dehydratase [Flavitalea sp.]